MLVYQTKSALVDNYSKTFIPSYKVAIIGKSRRTSRFKKCLFTTKSNNTDIM